jgi:hypothetical protein
MLFLSMLAYAGYGDASEGYPSREERWLHLWTNAVRVAPTDFEAEYAAGGCSVERDFSEDEKTPKAPLYLDYALNEVARFHSEDMAENGCFQHESCDGTDTWDRIGRVYSDSSYLGENIAMAGQDGRYAVLSMWMCSHAGHRANIMNGDYNELGTGVAVGDGYTYFTQDFASGSLDMGMPPVRMAAEAEGEFYADWGDTAPPRSIKLVLRGESANIQDELSLAHGTARQGIYYLRAGSPAGCSSWYIAWEKEDGTKGFWPEEGQYYTGSSCGEDWSLRGAGLPGEGSEGEVEEETEEGELRLTGCSSTSRSSLWALAGVGLLFSRRARHFLS